MFSTIEEIRKQLAAGEDNFAEFKEIRFGNKTILSPNTEAFAGEMVAFANAEGGTLFLGVNDQGLVQGIPEERRADLEQWVINIASNNCDPPIRPIIRKVILPDVSGHDAGILVVSIPGSLYVHRTSGGRWYIRIGSTKQDLTQQELARLFQQRGRMFVFDEMTVPTATEDDLDPNTLQKFFGDSPGIPLRDLLVNTRVAIEDEEGFLRPTVAGLLIFATNPQFFLPSAYIEACVYRGLIAMIIL